MNSLPLPQQKQGFSLTAFDIKIWACFFMLIDHIGFFFFPDLIIFRLIGRLCFPLFAFMIANGFFFTHNRLQYLLRLAIFGTVIQLPYWLFFTDSTLNIFFTLSLGLASIWLWHSGKKRAPALALLLVTACAVAAEFIHADYGAYGVLLIFFAYLFFNNLPKLAWAWVIINIATFLIKIFLVDGADNFINYIQPAALLSLFFLHKYNRKEGIKAPLLFYIFYPTHLAALYLISIFI
jgi:hypothetical protein